MGVRVHVAWPDGAFQNAHEIDFDSFFVHVDDSSSQVLSFLELDAEDVHVDFDQYVGRLSEDDVSLIRQIADGDTQTERTGFHQVLLVDSLQSVFLNVACFLRWHQYLFGNPI